MWSIHLAFALLVHRLCARSSAGLHSPFLFELLQYAHDKSVWFYAFDEIETIRATLLDDHTRVDMVDFGAGSRTHRHDTTRKISEIARTSLTPARRCQLIFRMLSRLRPQHILELGTALGVTTSYIAAACPRSIVHTVEGNPALAMIAQDIAGSLKLDNIRFHTGRFSDVLPTLRSNWDFVVIDGDHRGEALLQYFDILKPRCAEHTVILIDDIRWSPDMYAAWKQICADRTVRCSLDYFRFGLIFFRTEFLESVHLPMRY